MPIFSALIGGREYDRLKKPRLILLSADLGMAGALVVCSIHSLYAALAGSIFAGIVFGVGLTTAFAAAKDLNKEPKQDRHACDLVGELSLFIWKFWTSAGLYLPCSVVELLCGMARRRRNGGTSTDPVAVHG